MENQILKPSLIVDENKCRKNIERMIAKSKKHHLIFRPHFKTHQSVEIGRWFREAGVEKITVSSLDMANYFASDGWADITVAFPVNWLEIDKINKLNERVTLNLLVESIETVNFLQKKLIKDAGVFIKIDAGYHRTGIDINKTSLIQSIIKQIEDSPQLRLKGFLAHNGHTYKTNSINEIAEIHQNSLHQLKELKNKFSTVKNPLIVSIGDTPSSSIMDNFDGADEIRPGNFVFYDLVQEQLGSCSFNDISVAIACPVIAKHPERNSLIIYGGGVHLSKEMLSCKNGQTIYGRIVLLHKNGWSDPIADCYLSSISQEHGIVSAPDSFIKSIQIGDIIGVLPVHSCMTADLQPYYINFQGGKIRNYRI